MPAFRERWLSNWWVEQLVVSTLTGLGIDVINTGLSTTPTVEMTVIETGAQGGIIITASHNPHNPKEWNALKLLNEKGEFISAEEGLQVLDMADNEDFDFVPVTELGHVRTDNTSIDRHIDKILALDLVGRPGNCCQALGVDNVIELYCEPTGEFPHNPEPLPEHLTEISRVVREEKASLGIVVDPDVDRLAHPCSSSRLYSAI